jgi:nicotinate-nucleotide--dimethylbenzimidazole phosphoribosyltransferase
MELIDRIQQRINQKTKPLGALGKLESLALQIGLVLKTEEPVLKNPCIVVFAGDHGIASQGVSAYPSEVTAQMVLNFVNGGAAINVFACQFGIELLVVDAGVNYAFDAHLPIIHHKVGFGTQNFLEGKAISDEALKSCFQFGEDLILNKVYADCNVIGFGEMGIGNTSAAALLFSVISGLPIAECVGRGTGLSDAQLQTKIDLLTKARNLYPQKMEALEALQTFGGFEIAQMTAAMIAAFNRGMIILVDGFISSAAFLVARAMQPEILNNAVFCHTSGEQAHKKMLDLLGVESILNLQMRLGEGTGCALAYPILQASLAFLNEMASFEAAGVSTQTA